MSNESWTCPFCNHVAVVRQGDKWNITRDFHHSLTPDTGYAYYLYAIFCPNKSCKKTAIKLQLFTTFKQSDGNYAAHDFVREWSLLPESGAKPFPDYIPTPIISDYQEACLIASLSPKPPQLWREDAAARWPNARRLKRNLSCPSLKAQGQTPPTDEPPILKWIRLHYDTARESRRVCRVACAER